MSLSETEVDANEQDVDLTELWMSLTGFKRDVLVALAEIDGDDDRTSYGLEIKRALGEDASTSINHGRLYPNLDELRDEGIISKSKLDKRTNQYALTTLGYDLLESRRRRMNEVLVPEL